MDPIIGGYSHCFSYRVNTFESVRFEPGHRCMRYAHRANDKEEKVSVGVGSMVFVDNENAKKIRGLSSTLHADPDQDPQSLTVFSPHGVRAETKGP